MDICPFFISGQSDEIPCPGIKLKTPSKISLYIRSISIKVIAKQQKMENMRSRVFLLLVLESTLFAKADNLICSVVSN